MHYEYTIINVNNLKLRFINYILNENNFCNMFMSVPIYPLGLTIKQQRCTAGNNYMPRNHNQNSLACCH